MTDSPSPITINTEEIQNRLLRAIELDGDLTEKEYRRLVMLSLTSTHSLVVRLLPLLPRVKKLEDVSIILLAKKFPRVVYGIFALMTLWFVFVHDIVPWIVHIFSTLSGLKL